MINTAFLEAGLLDEISLLVGAGIDGRGGMPAVLENVVLVKADMWQLSCVCFFYVGYCFGVSSEKKRAHTPGKRRSGVSDKK